jgi:hypothetical protein
LIFPWRFSVRLIVILVVLVESAIDPMPAKSQGMSALPCRALNRNAQSRRQISTRHRIIVRFFI